jgi:hypothetical protein
VAGAAFLGIQPLEKIRGRAVTELTKLAPLGEIRRSGQR